MAANATQARLMVRLKPEAKERLRQYAAELGAARGRTVPMVKALEEVLLSLPLGRRHGKNRASAA
jgi:hypothetical protein